VERWACSRTVTIGKRLANAMSPKPSTSGLRPGIVDARPRPRAATSGTVTVEVVTPPVSNASARMEAGALHDRIATTAYPPTM